MNKLFTLLFASAFALSASAQTDVTSKYIKNPSFEQNGTSGWVNSGLAAQGNNSFEYKAGGTYLEKWVSTGNKVGSASVSQTIESMEPGKYTLTVAAQNLNQGNKTEKCTGVSIYAGKATTTVYTPGDYAVDFTYVSGEIEIGFKAAGATGNWIAVDNFRLSYNGAPEVDEMKSALTTVITTATDKYGDGSGNNAEALKSAIDAANAVMGNEGATAEELVEQYKALQAAINTYCMDNVSEENPIDYTKYITNPSFEQSGTNGWTNVNLVTQTNTSFKKKAGSVYLEKWVSSGSAGHVSISQTISIPNGKYKLVVAAQNLKQSNETLKCGGMEVFAEDCTEPIYTPNDYSLKFNCVIGEATIGVRSDNPEGNWVAVDNFRLYLIGNVSIDEILEEIETLVGKANSLSEKMMNSNVKWALIDAIDAAIRLDENSTADEIRTAKKALETAIVAAEVSSGEYEALAHQCKNALEIYDEGLNGAAEFKAEIDKAIALSTNPEATTEEILNEMHALDNAILAFRLANAPEGGSTTLKVTATNRYVPTGATEALMRATMTGTNVLERGICWSTEHEPTVLDNRTTESHNLNGNIYHARNLKPATVYYLRPYIMSNTYEVAYGDEVKIVTHPKGTCTGSWDNGAPDEAANTRCRNAINETIEYFNQWTGIKGFHLSGHYGAQTPTADCSYGGWMRIGPNAGNQAIGTVIHETGHGVGVGTSDRWWDTNVHNWKWYGREANEMYSFLENKTADPWNSEFCMVGDGTHGWGSSATYDWFVNGADKDKHQELQYLGGCCLLYALFVDGLCPTGDYHNGLPGYTYNFDDAKKYYIMSKDSKTGLGDGLLYMRGATSVGWKPMLSSGEEVSDSAAWTMEYNPTSGYYQFVNVETGKYLSHSASGTSMTLKSATTPGATENFQLMPDRKNVSIGTGKSKITTHGYWFTWYASGNKAMQAKNFNAITGYGSAAITSFNFADSATDQQWIIISEDELEAYRESAIATGISHLTLDDAALDGKNTVTGIYTTDGMSLGKTQRGFNIIRYSDGTTKKIYVK